MENTTGHRRLNVYVKAKDLVLIIYKITTKFPREELFGLVSQMRRCAVSVVANIVEGYSRRTANDKIHFYYMARGSLTELEFYIDLSSELNYLDKANYQYLCKLRDDVGRLLNGFMKSVK